MTDALLERSQGRGGELTCICDPQPNAAGEDSLPPNTAHPPGLLALAAANGFSIVAQALALSVLPVAGSLLAPRATLGTLPFMALLVGAVCGSLPAAYLTTGMDRRFGFGLGASMGLAGACIAAWAIAYGKFPVLVLGAFWMGVAQGFGQFYRHSAATGARARNIAMVLGAGALAGLLAPGLVSLARQGFGPLMPSALILMAGGFYLLVLLADLTLPEPPLTVSRRSSDAGISLPTPNFMGATAAAAVAWFSMAAIMGGVPLAMTDCGIDSATQSGLISWHLLAMYLPALGVGYLLSGRSRLPLLFVGMMMALASVIALPHVQEGIGFAALLIAAGLAWSLTNVAATAILHDQGMPSRRLLAVHDSVILLAAVAGAWGSTLLH